MKEFKSEDFIKGDKTDKLTALYMREDCNGFIDSIIEEFKALNLTKEEQKKYGIEIDLNDSYGSVTKRLKVFFGVGRECSLSNYKASQGNEVYKITHKMEFNDQLESDAAITLLSLGAIVGSHRLFSYSESVEHLSFDQGDELSIKMIDEENYTYYDKLGITKVPVFNSIYSTFDYRKSDSYSNEYKDGKNIYTNLDGEVLKQEEVVATSFKSFDNAYESFADKVNFTRDLINQRLEQIKMIRNNKSL